MPQKEPLIPKHGGYRRLKSFQIAQLVYDVTVRFCDRYIERGSRTRDQMVQAARSGVQNIAEGSQAAGTSRKFEIKLTSVARASLEELRLDYEDFLRQRNFDIWHRDDPRRTELIARRLRTADQLALWVKLVRERAMLGRGNGDGRNGDGCHGRHGLHGQGETTDSVESMASMLSMQSIGVTSPPPSPPPPPTYPAIAANAALVLITVACSLLERQLRAQSEAFEREGGFTERMHRVRSMRRNSR